jgi:hypothetical protein
MMMTLDLVALHHQLILFRVALNGRATDDLLGHAVGLLLQRIMRRADGELGLNQAMGGSVADAMLQLYGTRGAF